MFQMLIAVAKVPSNGRTSANVHATKYESFAPAIALAIRQVTTSVRLDFCFNRFC